MIACLGYTYSVLRGQINSHGMFDFKAGALTFICRYAPPDLWPQAESPQFSRCEEPTEATDTSAQHHTEGERVYHTYKATGACISPFPLVSLSGLLPSGKIEYIHTCASVSNTWVLGFHFPLLTIHPPYLPCDYPYAHIPKLLQSHLLQLFFL